MKFWNTFFKHRIVDSKNQPAAGGAVQYYDSGWRDLGTTGTVTRATVSSVEGWATPEELELIDQEAYAQRVSVPMAPRLSTATHGGYQPALA